MGSEMCIRDRSLGQQALKLRSLDPNFRPPETTFQVDETACFPQFQENIVNFPVFSLLTLDFDVSCSASVFDFFVELKKIL